MKQGDYKNALLRHQKALDIRLRCFGPLHASVAMTKGNMGYVYLQLGQSSQAPTLFEEVYDIVLRSFGPKHPNTRQAARDLERSPMTIADRQHPSLVGVRYRVLLPSRRSLPTPAPAQCAGFMQIGAGEALYAARRIAVCVSGRDGCLLRRRVEGSAALLGPLKQRAARTRRAWWESPR